ncbi:chemotaxis protein CheW [Oceanispirochaeta sp.]|jgi:purine-binding chemotaxis protein CheW|uniref:chemotaxis protein CheW n=1 Tax=Oceanispirochaeta sp. TaxID=2035350 RepID=UPI002606010E|nr:chemotaxis protein CheW [Oceanispirochaeta sp.]MDA3957645.1 chemotaxis protein CheW [Oceanispirochaeta sp.]
MIETKLNQYLTFTVASEQYAINVTHIREVLEFQSVSKVPRMPDFMRGIINLRGSVVPVLDLKMKFGLGETEKDIDTSVIVTEMTMDGDTVVIGLLTDAVSEVLELEDDEIEPTPYIGTKVNTEFIRGMGKKGDAFIIILDINKVLTHQEIVSAVSETSS